MKNTWKKFTILLTCACLSAGCAISTSEVMTIAPQASEIESEVVDTIETADYEIEPGESDDTPVVQPQDYQDEEYLNNEPVTTDIAFAQQIEEATSSYYEEADQQGDLAYFNYKTYDYDGDQSEEEKYAVIYTPYGYEAGKKYDILYLMHGVYGYAEIFLGYPGEPTEMKNCIDHLIEEGKMNPMIIVCMSYYDHNEQQINDNEDADITKAFSNEFKNDLMPAVESAYSTYAASGKTEDLIASRDHRIFAGFSMGGVTTWYAFAQSMAYCRYYLPMSGMLYWGPDYPQHKQHNNKWSGQFLAKSLALQGYTKDDFFIYIATGGYDEAKPMLEDQLLSMGLERKIFKFGAPFEEGVNCTYAYSEYEAHSWQAVFQYLYNGLPILSQKINEHSGKKEGL